MHGHRTLNFASIMGIVDDTHLVGQQYSWLTTCGVCSLPCDRSSMANDSFRSLSCHVSSNVTHYASFSESSCFQSCLGIPHEQTDPATTHREVSRLQVSLAPAILSPYMLRGHGQHLCMGRRPRMHCCLQGFHRSRHRADITRYLRDGLPACVRLPLDDVVSTRGASSCNWRILLHEWIPAMRRWFARIRSGPYPGSTAQELANLVYGAPCISM